MSVLAAFLFQLSTDTGPIDTALRATEAPSTLRAAFTVQLTSADAVRHYAFDPRKAPDERWQLVSASGEDSALDEAAAAWGAEVAPDGRLFPDDLRASLGETVHIDDLGAAWRVRFKHAPSANDTALDVWATQRLSAEAWLDPASQQILRIDYDLPSPVPGPNGGRLTEFRQSYLLEQEPVWNLSYVARYSLEFEAKAGFRTLHQRYDAVITEATFFFSSKDAQSDYVQKVAVLR